MTEHPNIYNTLSLSSSLLNHEDTYTRNPIPLTVDGCGERVGYSSEQCQFMIVKHVDVIWLYVTGPEDFAIVNDILKVDMGFKRIDGRTDDSVYERQSQYSSVADRTSIQILHKHKKNVTYPESMSLRIHDPSREFADTFHHILNYKGIKYIVNRLELTFDFYSNCIVTMQNFLEGHLYVCHRISGKNGEGNFPFRTENGLFSRPMDGLKGHGMKIYRKNVANRNFVRLELVMGRVPIKKHGYDLRLEGVESLNLSRYFKFMRLDKKKITDFYIRKYSTPPPPPDEEMSDLRRRLEAGGVIEWEYMNGEVFQDPSLLFRLSKLKKMGFPNYSRFMKPLTDFQETFNAEISKQEFLKPKNFNEWDFLYKPKVKLIRRPGK